MLTIEHLSLCYHQKNGTKLHALNDLSLTLAQGQILGLIGESGCGKTSLCHVLTKSLPYHQGSIKFGPTELSAISAKELKAYYAKVQYIFQDPKSAAAPHLNLEHLALAPLKNLKGLSTAEAKAQIVKLMAEVELEPALLRRYASEVSLGQLQRLSLIKSLALSPKLLLCDEITSALDPVSTELCLKLITRYVQEQGLSVLFITHDLKSALDWCPQIAVMFKGQIIEQGPADSLRHPYVQHLKNAHKTLAGLMPASALKTHAAPPLNGAPTLTCPMQQDILCPWLMRCVNPKPPCFNTMPPEHRLSSDHYIRCHLV